MIRRALRLSCLASALCAAAPLAAQPLPDAVRPGAIRPDQRPLAPPPRPAGPAYELPPVPERPLDIDAGERIAVSAFALDGVVDRPAFDIRRDAVQAIVDQARAERPEGFTVGRLQETADRVTRYYRERGLILAQAFVPEQTIADGVVQIRVLEGELGRVLTEGNDMYSAAALTRPFKRLIGEPVANRSVEARLLGLSDYPGLSTVGVFQPGQQVGTTDLVIRVQRERRFSANARIDNHGLRETGRRRYRAQAQLNNPTGAGDWLGATAQLTANPSNAVYWFAVYDRPIADRWRLSLSADENEFDVGGEFRDQDISSRTWGLGAALTREFIRSRQRNLTATAALDRKHAQTTVAGELQTRDDLSVLTLRANYDSVDARFAGLNAVLLQYSRGFDDLLGSMDDAPGLAAPSRVDPNSVFARGQFDKLLFAASRLQSLSLVAERLRHHSLLLRTELQWSDDLLVPMEQYAIGGPANVRAYQPTEGLFDKALFASVEWIWNAPFIADKEAFANRTWGEVLQLSAFYDWAYGRLNRPLVPEERSETYGGAGLGLTFTYPDLLTLRLIAARRVTAPRSENGRQPQYWIDLTFDY